MAGQPTCLPTVTTGEGLEKEQATGLPTVTTDQIGKDLEKAQATGSPTVATDQISEEKQATDPPTVTTDEIGEDLENEYGDKDPDTPIDYFYVRLGREINDNMSEQAVISKLHTVLGKSWKAVIPGWHGQGLLIVKYSREEMSLREQEKMFTEKRDTLKKELKELWLSITTTPPAIHVMFSRACLYSEFSREESMTTERIGKVLDSAYNNHGNNQIDYFYLFVKADQDGILYNKMEVLSQDKPTKCIGIDDMALLILKDLPGEWRLVESRETWPGTFFGFFPKQMSERERESRLNEDVRIPFIGKLKHLLAHATQGSTFKTKPTVHVLITRACKYYDTRSDT